MRKGLLAALTPLLFIVPMMVGGSADEGGESLGGEKTSTPSAVSGVPAEYREAVIRAGAVCEQISAPAIAAQIEAESGWDPKAQSLVGAQGISQFMPETWDSHGKDGDGDGQADVWNPADAIWSQAHYMCELSGAIAEMIENGEVQGDPLELTLAAYNAGIGTVQEARGIPPYPDTQQYVAAIIETMPRFMPSQGQETSEAGPVAAMAISTARNYIGLPYVWAGESGAGMDCSGLTMLAYRAAGVELTHSSRVQYGEGTQVPVDQAQPGDLLFWSHDGTQNGIYHVALYLGEDRVIEAPTFGMEVREAAVDHQELMPNAVRPY